MIPVEGFQPTLSKLVAVLDCLHVRFHLTGGITSVAYGEPRMTQDLDVVLGVVIPIVSRADAALSKLIWIQHGSHRSRFDLRRIMAGATADEVVTVREKAREMELAPLLDEVLDEQDSIDV